jgi:hypothetical protein
MLRVVRSLLAPRHARALLATAAFCAGAPIAADAHCLVGGRLFPSTLAIDDPCVNDELALPAFSTASTGDRPANRETEIGGHYAKRVFDNVAVMAGRSWSRLSTPGAVISGFGAIETGVKYQFMTLPAPELVISTGFFVEWGKTGRQSLGAPAFNVYTPTLFFGKGFGDLPNSLNALRPFAITGQFGYAIPGWRRTTTPMLDDGGVLGMDVERHPHIFKWGFSLQYSMAYLRQHVYDFDLPDFVNRLIPLVEVSLDTPFANTLTSGRTTTGTVNPGIVYAQKAWQIGVEAIIPINRASGKDIGARAQLHFILDEILPQSVTRPVFAGGPPAITRLGDQP